MRRRTLALGVTLLAVLALGGVHEFRGPRPHAEACAFDPRTPHTYEAEGDRLRYLAAIDAASVNGLLPGDPFFELPRVELGTRQNRAEGVRQVPVEILRGLGWVESQLTMASRSVRFESIGDTLVSFDCGHGIMQVTTGMTIPLGAAGRASSDQVLVATHYAFNASRGAVLLADKWNQAPQQRPIVGTDTNSDPNLIENWYYAVWSYNGFTGPGSRGSNHPLDPTFASVRDYRCDGSQSRNRFPYQELVWGCLAHPPEREGARLWAPVAASLPNVNDPTVFNALSIANFDFPFSNMDLPTPEPAHAAEAVTLPPNLAAGLFAAPVMQVATTSVSIDVTGPPSAAQATIDIRNAGTGVLAWQASTSDPFLVLSPPAGAAAGTDLRCAIGPCPAGRLTVTVNPTLLPRTNTSGTIRIENANGTGTVAIVEVEVIADFAIGAPGTSRER